MLNFKFVCLFVLSQQLTGYYCDDWITFTAIKKENNLEFDCDYNLTKSEDFFDISIKKDTKHLIYQLNKYMKEPAIIPVPGALVINQIDQGHISIQIDDQSSGKYECEIRYNDMNDNMKKELDIKVEMNSTELPISLKISPTSVKSGEHVSLTCNSNFTVEQLIHMSIAKDGKEFLYLGSDEKLQPHNLTGINIAKKMYDNPKNPIVSLSLKTDKQTQGKYKCTIVYLNKTHNYNTEIYSEEISLSVTSKSTIVYSNYLVILSVTLFIIISKIIH